MKEDKENTRPKEKKVEIKCEDGEKTEKPKEKKEAMTKIVIRRLPPSLTKEELEEQLQPLPEVDYLEFFSNDTSLYPHLFARAYINFKNQEDIVLFRDRFDGYVFIDSRGQEYPAIVEFAPFQKTAKKRSKKRDAKCGTIVEDPEYKKFLEYYNGDEEKLASTPETLLEELEAKSKELVAKKTTPLLDFLKNKQRIREEKKEERRRRELERKRLRDEERRKWREEERRKRKDAEKMKRLEKPLEKDKDQVKEEPKIKLLKKPDRGDNADSEKPKEKVKKPEKPNKEDRSMGSADHKRRQNIENKDDRGRKVDEDGRKEFRERGVDRDREREREREKERRQKEKERIRRQDEDRRRRRDRQDGENSSRRREEEVKKDKERVFEKKKGENTGDSTHSDRAEKPARDSKREESSKRERLRNKDRPAIQLYQPGARSRNRGGGGGGAGRGAESNSADRKADTETEKVADKGDD
ncbi:regulator of nonsense transcripts 3B [Micropterus dolomieu]|uniref:regulator of nonsense transcripts 3B n=1 Tax=Micropterus dolomieu TaxID=147949 RepID=UPI001E8DED5E|nr:regulator of nonsense transcripts 3B [Micropterus dolomieu]